MPAGASGSIEFTLSHTEGMEQGRVFSGPMIAAIAVAFILGIAVMWAFMSGANARALLELRTNDAVKLRDSVKPKVLAFKEVHEKIMKIDPNRPDGELAKQLAEADFAIPGSVLASATVPLPGGVTDSAANYAADSVALKNMLERHARITTGVDAKAIDEILAGNKAIEENNAFGVLFDVEDVRKNSANEGYEPKIGKLVGFKGKNEEDKNMYDIQFFGTTDVRQVEPEKVILIDKGQILKTGGENALSRYRWRVREIRFAADRISKYADSFVETMDLAATGDMDKVPDAAAAPAEGAAAAAPAEAAEGADEAAEGDEE